MWADTGPSGYDLRLIGMREQRSHNSWMHNAPSLMPSGRRLTVRIHPEDARERGIADGDTVDIESATGAVTVPASLTEDLTRGNAALPHGWGTAAAGSVRTPRQVSGPTPWRHRDPRTSSASRRCPF